MNTDWKPEGYHTVTPYLVVRDAAGLIAFVEKVFGAELVERMTRDDGSIMHAEVRIGDSIVMIGQQAEGATQPAMLYVYVEDADAAYRRAVDAGATSLREPTDEFYGDRSAGVLDAYGNQWWVATKREQLSSEELQRRAAGRAG